MLSTAGSLYRLSAGMLQQRRPSVGLALSPAQADSQTRGANTKSSRCLASLILCFDCRPGAAVEIQAACCMFRCMHQKNAKSVAACSLGLPQKAPAWPGDSIACACSQLAPAVARCVGRGCGSSSSSGRSSQTCQQRCRYEFRASFASGM